MQMYKHLGTYTTLINQETHNRIKEKLIAQMKCLGQLSELEDTGVAAPVTRELSPLSHGELPPLSSRTVRALRHRVQRSTSPGPAHCVIESYSRLNSIGWPHRVEIINLCGESVFTQINVLPSANASCAARNYKDIEGFCLSNQSTE